MKRIAIGCTLLLTGFVLMASHRAIAQSSMAYAVNVKFVEEERFENASAPEPQFADEQAIRLLVERQNRGERVINGTGNLIVASGAASVYPLVSHQPSAETLTAPERAVPVTHERIVRLVVAQSGELAYEYGNYALGLVATDPNRQSFDGAYLRVWRKQNGQWLVDAAFARP